MIKAEQVLRYWLGPLNNELAKSSQVALWYQATPAIDQEILAQFQHLYQQAKRQELSHWLSGARGSLALIILLDQLPRNMFRGTSNAFAADELAVEICLAGISQGFDKKLALIERIFYYHPFEHSENFDEQRMSVKLFSGLFDEYPEAEHQAVIKTAHQWAVEHLAIIEQFGRFPHRNKILNRTSTAEEIEYLKSASDFGQGAKK